MLCRRFAQLIALATFVATSGACLAGPVNEGQSTTGASAEPLFQPIYDLQSAELAFGRVALLGDAAFAARPHVGLGVTKAAGDAAILADALAARPGDVPGALEIYAATRREFGNAIVAHARLLGLGVGSPGIMGPQASLIAHLRRPEVVMREIAVPDWAERSVALRRLQVT